MNRSSFGDKTSGFSNSNDGNQNFSFNAPSVPRSGGSLSKPRMLKVRRHMNSLGLRSSSIPDNQFAPGFNPFIADRSIPSSFVPPKVSASDDLRFNKIGNDEFLLRENRNDPSLVSNSDSATTSLRGVIEEVKNLNIGSMNAKDTSIADETIGSKLPEDMKKLNIKDTGIGENSVKNKDMMFNLSAHNKTVIGVETEDNVGSSFGTHAIHRLPNELKKLNIKDTEQIRSGNGISGADNTNKFEIGSGKVADIGILRNSIPEKMKNLNIKDTEQIRSGNGISGADNTNKFEIGSGKVADIGILRNSIPEKMKNLNIENASNIESIEKNKANASSLKDMTFVESTTSSSNHISSSKNSLLLKKMEELKLGVKVEGSAKNIKSDSGIDCHQAAFTGYNSPAVRQEKDERNSQVASHQQTDSNNRNMTADEMPPMNRPEIATDKQDSFGVPFVFQTPNRKEFSATNPLSKNRSGKFKPPAIVQLWSDQDYVTVENSFQESREASDSYSPMDVSPYQEILADGQCTREILMTSEESFNHDPEVTSSVPVGTADDVDEDLLRATVRLDINEGHMINRGTIDAAEEDTGFCFSTIDGIKVLCEESVSGVETESFKSATEEIDFSSEVTSSPADTESCSTSNLERRDSDVGMHYYSESNPEDVAKSNFIFSASHGAQGQLSTTKSQYKKKNKAKGSHDIDIPSPNSNKVSFTSSSQFLSLSGNSPLLSPGRSKKELSFVPYNCGDEASMPKVQDTKIEFVSTSAATIAAQEVCEKWRLRGNSAYSNGDLSNAEDYYSKGVNCLSVNETSRSCRRALMLCYSNRAATRMSLGRMRDAISDCIMASSIDPSFLKVQLRAANCYLSLGEVEDATRYFKRCLQSGSECVDRKIVVEASEGLQRTARVSHCINQSAELLQTRVPNNAESALELIVEALVLSPCSEKLLEMKADALYTLRRLEEVIQVCEQTIDSAEANSPPVNDGNLVTNLGASEILKRFYFRVWRCHLILKSYFHLGRLEEGLALLEKQEEKVFEVTRYGSKILESSIPLAATVRELLRCKTAGNEAFQEGRHSDAVEHYTTAISCNVESRPFAAVCFCNRAAAYKALGQVLDAIADCSLAIALDTEYLKAISRRASLYEMIRDYGQAARDLQVLVSLFAKQLKEKIKQSGASDRSMNVSNDLKQARLRLLEIEEEDRKELPLDMYLILGIDASVSAAEIKKAYRKAALRHHPDKAGQSLARTEFGDEGLWKDRAAEVHKDADILFKIIGEAYAVLSDPIKRSRYDAEEEMRNTQKKRTGSSTSRRNTDFQSHQFEKSGNMRHWREVWRSYGNSTPGMSEVPRSSRY